MKRLVFAAAAFGLISLPVAAQEAAPSYTAAQVERGQGVYAANCAVCHGASMAGGGFGPSLKGARFRRVWGPQTVGALYDYIAANMPPGQGDAISADERADVVAYILSANGAPAGDKDLPSDSAALGAMAMPK